MAARPAAGRLLPISLPWRRNRRNWSPQPSAWVGLLLATPFLLMLIFYVIYPFIRLVQTALGDPGGWSNVTRSEEHTSELQSLAYLVCRLLLEKKNTYHRH